LNSSIPLTLGTNKLENLEVFDILIVPQGSITRKEGLRLNSGNRAVGSVKSSSANTIKIMISKAGAFLRITLSS
jgi:hypothetical protein